MGFKKTGLSRAPTGTHSEKTPLVQHMNSNRNPAVFINSYDNDNYK